MMSIVFTEPPDTMAGKRQSPSRRGGSRRHPTFPRRAAQAARNPVECPAESAVYRAQEHLMRSLRWIRVSALAVTLWAAGAQDAFADEAEGRYRTGLGYERKGDIQSAAREVREAVRLKPDHAAAW